MSKSIEALVKPELLRWARESGGFSPEQAAERARIPVERLLSWENGAEKPTVAQVRNLANVYRRPLAVFYLPEPPKTFAALHDFRRLPQRNPRHRWSPELHLAIRRARLRREVALDLHDTLDLEIPKFSIRASLSDNAETVGRYLRESLGVTYDEQIRWRNKWVAFRAWRDAFEAAGVLVFQATDVSVDEMRAFSLDDWPLPVTVVNIEDHILARIFSMNHELVHIALRQTGLCDLSERRRTPPYEQQIEIFCNHVAGAILVPADQLLQESIVAKTAAPTSWADDDISSLAHRYSVGRETIVRRLLILGRTTEGFYRRKRQQYQKEFDRLKRRQAQRRAERREQESGGPMPSRMTVSTAGPLFTRLVLEAYQQEKITGSDLSDYLDIRFNHLSKVEEELARASSR